MSGRVTYAPQHFDQTPSTNESHENAPTQKPPNCWEPCVLQRSDLQPPDPYPPALLRTRRATRLHALSASAPAHVPLHSRRNPETSQSNSLNPLSWGRPVACFPH